MNPGRAQQSAVAHQKDGAWLFSPLLTWKPSHQPARGFHLPQSVGELARLRRARHRVNDFVAGSPGYSWALRFSVPIIRKKGGRRIGADKTLKTPCRFD